MKRSSSWPQFSILENDNDEDLLYPEVGIEILQQKVSDFEIQNRSSTSRIETLNLEKANLQILNMKLIENSRLSSLQISNLENEKNQLIAQLKKAEDLVANLDKALEKADEEKIGLSMDLGLQQQAFEIVHNSKKEVEKQLEMFSEATARDRDWIESKASEELGFLTNQLQTLELHLEAKEEAAQHVEMLASENKKLQAANRELIKQNEGLERQLNELQVCLELQKEQNQLFHLEVENMKSRNDCSILLNAVPYEPQPVWLSSPTASRVSTLTSQKDGVTPPPLMFLEDFDDKTSDSFRDSEDEQQYDPMDEYIRLSVKAVKIQFPTLKVSSDRLIEIAKTVPFYRAHDVLSSYMQKLDIKQNFQKKRKKQLLSFEIDRPSMLEKVRGFFGCGVMLDNSQNYQCNELTQEWDESKNKTGVRVGF